MRKCTKCNEERTEDLFSFKNKDKNIKLTQCKYCIRAYNKIHYKNNPETYKICSRRNNAKRRLILKTKILEYLKLHPCIDCEESDPVVLTFDHIDIKNKKYCIAHMITKFRPWEEIIQEIAKCQVRCFNCHAKRTARQFNWWKLGR